MFGVSFRKTNRYAAHRCEFPSKVQKFQRIEGRNSGLSRIQFRRRRRMGMTCHKGVASRNSSVSESLLQDHGFELQYVPMFDDVNSFPPEVFPGKSFPERYRSRSCGQGQSSLDREGDICGLLFRVSALENEIMSNIKCTGNKETLSPLTRMKTSILFFAH